MGGQKAKKRVTYENDGWECDVCSNSHTSLRRNGPNNIRMCTACYSKMQREKKKGSADAQSERIASDDVAIDSHQSNIRGSRHASAAARKFIEEFAKNKGASEKNDGSQKKARMCEAELTTDQNSNRPTEEAADNSLTTNLVSVPRRTSEDLFKLAQSCCAAGNKILRRDGTFTPAANVISATESSRLTPDTLEQPVGNLVALDSPSGSPPGDVEQPVGNLKPCDDVPVRSSSKRSLSEFLDRYEREQPDVLQGAADLLHMMKEQAVQAGKVQHSNNIGHCSLSGQVGQIALWGQRTTDVDGQISLLLQTLSDHGHQHVAANHDLVSQDLQLPSSDYPSSTKKSKVDFGHPCPLSRACADGNSKEVALVSATTHQMVNGVDSP